MFLHPVIDESHLKRRKRALHYKDNAAQATRGDLHLQQNHEEVKHAEGEQGYCKIQQPVPVAIIGARYTPNVVVGIGCQTIPCLAATTKAALSVAVEVCYCGAMMMN